MGKGGGGTTQSTGTTYTTNLPEYAQPYVETMLGATQKQLFNTRDVTDAEGNTTTEITGFQPYTPYSSDPTKYVAGFSPLQQQAHQNIAGLQTPGAYGAAQNLAGMSGMGQFGTAGRAGMLGNMGTGIGMMGLAGAMPAFGAGQEYMQGVTDPSQVGAFMSPYQQGVTDVAKNAAIREAQMAENANRLSAARQGTYGGARQTLASLERERNLLGNLSNIQAQGSQSAYDRAIQNMQYGSNLGLQGIQTGLQGIQAGQQGVAQGLAGVGAQQAGYAGAGQAASTLGNLAGQEFGTQKDIIGLQQQAGTQQQQQQQQIINQAVQDYANAQQYPMMQLGFMSNMLRGLPMQSTSTQQYMAAPNQLTQGLGALGAGANIYSAFSGNTTRVAQGGQIKSYAKGGITSYDVGGNVKYDLSNIKDPEELKEIAKNTTSDTIRRDALRFAKMREMGLAGGGIVAFAGGERVRGLTSEDYTLQDSEELKARREADIAAALALKAEKDAVASQTPDAAQAGITQVQPSSGRFSAQGAGTSRFKTAEQRQSDGIVKTAADIRRANTTPDVGTAAATRRGITQAVLAPVVEDAAAPVETTNKKDQAAPVARNDLGETVEEQKRLKKDTPAEPVAKKQDTGIKAAAPDTSGISKARSGIPGLSPTAQAIYERALPEEQSLTDMVKEVRKAREETIGVDKGAQAERERVMAEKVDAKEEARRQSKLRQAKFWADFGSTPGPVLVAAMTAYKKNADNLIEGEKDARKVQNDLDKIIRDLNKAERLEQEGDFDAAYKLKLKNRDAAKEVNKILLQYQMNKETAQVRTSGTDKIQQEKLLISAQKDLGSARRALTDLRNKNKNLYDKAAMPGEGEAIDKIRNSAKTEIAKLEAPHLAQIEEAQGTLKSLRKHGDIVIPSDKEIESTELGTAANPIKLKPAKG